MRGDIDLRTRRFKADNRLIKPKTLFFIHAFLIIAAFTALYCSSIQYAAHLESEVDNLRAVKSDLVTATDPLKVMAEETKRVETLTALKASLSSEIKGCSLILLHILSAAPSEVKVESVKIFENRELEISGSSADMQAAALYRNHLLAFNQIEIADIASITLQETGQYNFLIKASIVSYAGEEQHVY
jgi:hypothetical protein